MSRGGRGGFAGGAGRIGGKDFSIDADLEDQVLAYQDELGDDDQEWQKTLYPVCLSRFLHYQNLTDATFSQ